MKKVSKKVNIKKQDDILILVNKQYGLPSDYIPDNLVVPEVKWVKDIDEDSKKMRKEAALALEALAAEGDKQGMQLFCESAYRSYERQKRIFEQIKRENGEEYASRYCAPPGHSEHQTGLCVDITNINIDDAEHDKALGQMKEGIWLKNNAHLFGFILRYPEDKTAITGYNYEPWHFRYVGREAATEIYNKGLILEEYFGVI